RVSPTPSRLNHFWLKPYRFPVSRDRIAESESALVSPSHHFDNRGPTTFRGMNGIAAADNQRFEGYIDGCGIATAQQFTFSRRFGTTISTKYHADSAKQHAVSTKYNCHSARVDNIDWSIGHHDKSAAVRRFWTSSFPSHSQSTGEYK
ncbi:hypothetical protein CR513_61706, partial [Mucuna pruriens]